MAASSLRPISRVRISSAASLISNCQPEAFLTTGIGSCQSLSPTTRCAVLPSMTVLWRTFQSRRKRSTASGSTPSGGRKSRQFSPSRLLIALSFCSLIAFASASVAWSGVLKDCCAIAVAETMNNTIPLSSLFFMSVPLTMTEFTVFSTPARRLA